MLIREYARKVNENQDSKFNLVTVNLRDIREALARRFVAELRITRKTVTVDAYVCSDGRNSPIRRILKHVPYVNVIANAGNAIYAPNETPTVVIAHGHECGAVGYARQHGHEDDPALPGIAELIKGEAIENAIFQLQQVPEEHRAGVIYFDHQKGKVELPEDQNYAEFAHCRVLYDELLKSLENRFTDEEISSMAEGQDPEIIWLNRLHTDLTAFNTFEVDIQRGQYHQIISDSLEYAISHALNGDGSFKSSKTLVCSFPRGKGFPDKMNEFFDADFVHEYISRGGEVVIVSVGNVPSHKTLYRMELRK